MFDTTRPTKTRVVAKLGTSAHYAGSTHDPETARKFGYRSALIPGAFLYGFMTQQAVAEWGMEWVQRGAVDARFRRPAFDGDELVLHASPLRRDATGWRVDMEIHDAEGHLVASGGVGLPVAAPPPPDMREHPILPIGADRPSVAAGELVEGTRLGTRNLVLTAEAHAQSLADFGESWPSYTELGIAHSGLLLRISMGDANASRRFPTPVILVAAAAEHLGVVRTGDRLSTSGVVTSVYERKGNHYFDSEELLIANGRTPVARFHRTSIYAVRAA